VTLTLTAQVDTVTAPLIRLRPSAVAHAGDQFLVGCRGALPSGGTMTNNQVPVSPLSLTAQLGRTATSRRRGGRTTGTQSRASAAYAQTAQNTKRLTVAGWEAACHQPQENRAK